MKDILELKMVGQGLTGECHWPVAEKEGRHFFCGAPVREGASYCEECGRRATNPTRHYVDSKAIADALGGGPSRGRSTASEESKPMTVTGYMAAGAGLRPNGADRTRGEWYAKRHRVVA